MAEKCPVCGEKVGGFTGKAEPFQKLLDEGLALGPVANGAPAGWSFAAASSFLGVWGNWQCLARMTRAGGDTPRPGQTTPVR